jgi:hypothetical protein
MLKAASVALSVALGIAGVAQSPPADAHPDVSVAIGVPGGAAVEPLPLPYASVYYAPYFYTHARYWRHEYVRSRRDCLRHGRRHRHLSI